MSEKDEVVEILRKAISPPFKATMGDGAGNVVVAGRPGYVWCRKLGRSEMLMQAYNRGAQNIEGIIVLVQESRIEHLGYEVVGYASGASPDDVYPPVPPHAWTHEWRPGIGRDRVTVYPRAWGYLRAEPIPSGSMNVWVTPGWYYHDDYLRWYPGGYSPGFYPPPAGTWNQLLSFDPSDESLHVTNGSVVGYGLRADIPTPSGCTYPIAAIESTGTFGSVTENMIEDIRLFMDPIEDCGGLLPFGSCYGNHIAWVQANAVQNTWYNISDTDIADGPLEGVTHDGSGKLTVTEPGEYLILYSLCYLDNQANDHLEVGIEVNGSGAAEEAGRTHSENKFANEEEHLGGGTILNLPDNATVELAIRTIDAGTPTITVDGINLSLHRLGEGEGGGARAHNLLDGSVHPDTVAQAVVRGSLIVGEATLRWDELPIGAAARYLRSDGTDPSYVSIPASEVVNTPAGGIAAIDVQTALNELDTEKAGIADAETISADWTWSTDKKIFWRDAAIYIHSAADGFLDLVADTAIRVTGPLQVNAGAGDAVALFESTDGSAWIELRDGASAPEDVLLIAIGDELSIHTGNVESVRVVGGGNFGLGIATPGVINGVDLTTQHVLHVYSATLVSRIAAEGANAAVFDLVDRSGAANQKWAQTVLAAETFAIQTLNDAGALVFTLLQGSLATGNVYPGGNKTQDFGLPATAWDDAYADDWHNVADLYLLDRMDDLAVICGIQPSGEIDPRTGLPLIDDKSLPKWVFTKDKKGKEVLYDPDGKPYISVKMLSSLAFGGIRQLKEWVERLEAQIPA